MSTSTDVITPAQADSMYRYSYEITWDDGRTERIDNVWCDVPDAGHRESRPIVFWCRTGATRNTKLVVMPKPGTVVRLLGETAAQD